LLRRVMATNYTDIFSAYKYHITIYQHLSTEAGYFGWASLSYALAGMVGLLGFRETRRMSLFMFLQAGLIFCHFTSVQGFCFHHQYLLLPGFLLVVSVFTLKVACLPSRGWLRIAWLGSVLAFGLGTSVPVFSRPARLHAKTLGRLMPVNPCYPLVRNDVPELIRMFSVLDRYFEQSDGRVYVLAASHTFSSDTLLNAAISLPVPFNSTDRVITQCSHVDKRDGFPRELLNAQFVLVATPVQYHLRPADQQVIGVPAESFLNQTDIGRAFEKLPESFVLENGARVLLFRRTRPIEPAEVAQLSERFRASYPDRPYIYRP